MTEYFDKRASRYLDALDMCPTALEEEYITAVKQCDLADGHTLLTIPSSCERITPFLPSSVRLIQYETTRTLSDLTGIPFCTYASIPEKSNSIDRILCLASLHHLTTDERLTFYVECKRLLRPGGKLIIGDVEAHSSLASWLNVFVNEYNPVGHNGLFFSDDDALLLRHAGFDVSINRTDYRWRFPNKETMLTFTRSLFMLECDVDTLLAGIQQYLSPGDADYKMGLLYFQCSI